MVVFREAEEKDFQKINDFQNKYYSRNRTLEEFYWGFVNCPFGKSIYFIAEDGDRVIATNCITPIELINAEGKTELTGKSEDTLLDPDYWGQPIFYTLFDKLTQACKARGITAIWGFTPAKKAFKRLKFELPYNQSQSLIINNIIPSYKFLIALNKKNTLVSKGKILALCTLSRVRSMNLLKITPGFNYKITTINSPQSLNEILKDSLSKNGDSFTINLTPEYQNWRIYKNPYFYKTHTFNFYDSKEVLKAVLVFNSSKDKIAYLCQCAFSIHLKDNEKVQMIRKCTRSLFKEGIHIIRCWHFQHTSLNQEEINIFQKAGYTFLKRGMPFVWKAINSTELKPENFVLSRLASQGTS